LDNQVAAVNGCGGSVRVTAACQSSAAVRDHLNDLVIEKQLAGNRKDEGEALAANKFWFGDSSVDNFTDKPAEVEEHEVAQGCLLIVAKELII
jgi:hypothetical protein